MEEKRVGIICSSIEGIDSYYIEIASNIASYFAKEGYSLVFGGGAKSMMGACYQEFKKNNREIYAYTTNPYEDELNMLETDHKMVCNNTFEIKKRIFEDSDIVVALPGGIGTWSEIFSFIEEKRSNGKTTPLEIYDEDGYYLPLIELISIMQMKGMTSMDIENEFRMAHNMEELEEHLEEYKGKGVK